MLVDDHVAMRIGISSTIENRDDMEVVGEADNGIDAIQMAKELNPDVIVMDLRMPEQDGMDTIRALKKEAVRASILVYSNYANGDEIYKVLQAGAMGFVVKDMPLKVLHDAIRAVAKGERFVPAEVSSRIVSRVTTQLTSREIEILEMVAGGFSNKEIADRLSLVHGTVKVHLANIFRKINVSDRTQAVMYALKNHLIKIE